MYTVTQTQGNCKLRVFELLLVTVNNRDESWVNILDYSIHVAYDSIY